MADYQKVGSYDFVAEPFCSDFRGHMAIGVLGNLLLNVAEFHASDRALLPSMKDIIHGFCPDWCWSLSMMHPGRPRNLP